MRELAFVSDRRLHGAMCAHRGAASSDSDDCAGRPRPEGRVASFGDGGADSLEARARSKPTHFRNCDTAADDTALIAFTSGTTGEGKGTMHFHRDVMAVTDCFPRYVLKADADDLFCGSPPFAFTYGLGGLVLFPMRVGPPPPEQGAPASCSRGSKSSVRRSALPRDGLACHVSQLAGVTYELAQCVSAGEIAGGDVEAWLEATGIRIRRHGATEMLHLLISAGDYIRPGQRTRRSGLEARV